MITRVLYVILFAVFCLAGNAQVVVNEYSASNLNQFPDLNNRYEDWIELHNTSGSTANIGGMYLSDRQNKPTKWIIPAGTSIPGNDFLIFWCSGRDTLLHGELHTSFKLSQTTGKDSVIFSDASGTIAEQYPLATTHNGHSRCRTTDGSTTWKVCTFPTLESSNNGSPQKYGYSLPANISLGAGFYSSSQTTSISTGQANSEIRYTIDGTAPTPSSSLYSGAISIPTTIVLKATVFPADPQILPSLPATNTFFINETFTLPVISIAADSVIDLANGDGDIKPIGSIEYFDKVGNHIAESYGSLNRHGQDSWALPHRSIDWVSRDEMGHSKAINAQLFSYSERDAFQRIIFRASGDDNYPAVNDGDHDGACHIRDEYVHTLAQNGGMKLDVRAVERAIVFLNGQYWGVYAMRERPVDHDYIKEYYGHGKWELQYLTTWGSTDIEYGGQRALTDWEILRDWILSNDLGIPANYQFVDDNLRLTSLCDYMIANLNSVASDWLNYNTGWYRGLNPNGNHKKWGYILWDNDATFDYYINYSGVPNTNPDAVPCDIDDIADFMDDFFSGPWSSQAVGMHEKIFLKLQQESETFRQLYYSRQADMMNTIYTCENMIATLDTMIAVIDPEMDRQIARWGGSRTEWEQNLADLRNFVLQRCTLLDDGMIDCFNLTGPYPLTLDVQPVGAGKIHLNTITLEQFPWTGNYFGVMDNIFTAEADSGMTFSHWETSNGTVVSASPTDISAKMVLTQSDTLTAVFNYPAGVQTVQSTNLDFSVYPTIAKDHLVLTYELTEPTEIQVTMLSMIGNEVTSFSGYNFSGTAGRHSYELNIGELQLSPGYYILNISTGNSNHTAKVVIQ